MYHFPSFCNLSCFYYASNVLKVSSICTFLQLLIKCEKFLFYNVIFAFMQIFPFRLSTFLLFKQTFMKFDILFHIPIHIRIPLVLTFDLLAAIFNSSTNSSNSMSLVLSASLVAIISLISSNVGL